MKSVAVGERVRLEWSQVMLSKRAGSRRKDRTNRAREEEPENRAHKWEKVGTGSRVSFVVTPSTCSFCHNWWLSIT